MATFKKRYELIEPQLGEGGFGTVYKARDKHTSEFVAIKKLKPEHRKDPELRKRFLQEPKAVLRLKHDNIVTVTDFERDENADELWFAMEYLAGESLDTYCYRQPSRSLTEAQTIELLLPICEGISFAHKKEVLHRDLKPQNIILVPTSKKDPSPNPKILDFGLARDGERLSKTKTGFGAYSEGFASPEQLKGMKQTDERTDVFALGAILYFCLKGHPPIGVIDKKNMSAGMQEILAKTLAPALEDRYLSVKALQAKLEELKKELPEEKLPTVSVSAPETRKLPSEQTTGPSSSGELQNAKPSKIKWLFVASALMVLVYWAVSTAPPKQENLRASSKPVNTESIATKSADSLVNATGLIVPPIFPVVLTPEQQQQYKATVDKAGALYAEEKYDDALLQFKEALKIDPYGPDAIYGAGNTLYDKGYYAFTDTDPNKNSEQKIEAAAAFLHEAIELLALGVQKHPTNARLQFTLAAVYEYRSKEDKKVLTSTLAEDRQKAKTAYEAYLALEPKGAYTKDAHAGIDALNALLKP